VAQFHEVAGVLVYCSDYKCSHSISLSADRWPDDARLSDLDWNSKPAAARWLLLKEAAN
jgi:hypothetical protein